MVFTKVKIALLRKFDIFQNLKIAYNKKYIQGWFPAKGVALPLGFLCSPK
jgi:hypothetical protein